MHLIRQSVHSPVYFHLSKASANTLDALQNSFILLENYFDEKEHNSLVQESMNALKKASWSSGHFDSVIFNYRESTVSRYEMYPSLNKLYKDRIIPDFFAGKSTMAPHILELSPSGYILPHLDNVHHVQGY